MCNYFICLTHLINLKKYYYLRFYGTTDWGEPIMIDFYNSFDNYTYLCNL